MPDDKMSYPPNDLRHMKKRVDRVLNKAAWNHRKKVHEGQWGALAHSLLEELALWPVGERLTILNTWVIPAVRRQCCATDLFVPSAKDAASTLSNCIRLCPTESHSSTRSLAASSREAQQPKIPRPTTPKRRRTRLYRRWSTGVWAYN